MDDEDGADQPHDGPDEDGKQRGNVPEIAAVLKGPVVRRRCYGEAMGGRWLRTALQTLTMVATSPPGS